jgi:folate-binding protein YgfZ
MPTSSAAIPEATRANAGGCWVFDAAALASPLRQPVRATICELGVIRASGEDAARFLHGQLTNDVEHLRGDRLLLAGYCTAKGRLLATFRLWRDGDATCLLLPREILPGVIKRLSMFVLRAKAKLVDDSDNWRVGAVFGAGAAAALGGGGVAVPAGVGDSVEAGAVRLARLHPGPRIAERFLVLARAEAADSALARLESLPEVDAGAFWWSEIDAAVPTVFAATQEKFVPQMINFELVGGVNFAKGCYPGQEVVARSQYRGKLKRRMQRAHCAAAAAAGTDVFADGEPEAAGTVVMAASAEGGGFDILFECPLEKAGPGLRLGAADGPPLELRALPYELVDVTA